MINDARGCDFFPVVGTLAGSRVRVGWKGFIQLKCLSD